MKKLKWWHILIVIIVINILLPMDKKLFMFNPIDDGLTFPILQKPITNV